MGVKRAAETPNPDTRFRATVRTLKKFGFSIKPLRTPDKLHFGNWLFTATRSNLAVLVTNDRNDVLLDLVPLHLFRPGSDKSER